MAFEKLTERHDLNINRLHRQMEETFAHLMSVDHLKDSDDPVDKEIIAKLRENPAELKKRVLD